MKKILVFENTHILTNHLIKEWMRIADESIEMHGRFCAALSGGRSPVEFYCKLSGLRDLESWAKTHIFLADERFVPLDNKDSNFGMIKNNFLNFLDIPLENIHPIPTSEENVLVAAEEYKKTLLRFFPLKNNPIPRFDFILLGLGEDGHTASLYPQDNNVDDPNRIVLPVSLPHLKEERISLTLSVINNARYIFFLAQGKKKASIIKKVMEEKHSTPAAKVESAQGQLTFLLDKEAAAEFSYLDSPLVTHHLEAVEIPI